ncbi:DinB family protein [Auraticoccus sp. F435]|uniref:DinB family protein n=1 Tax=Auraticoccus cholistanensis TaxID=2656650 RepID=A0A6A9USR5_9ACTN|nr:DinB family protein [Auraticoccus cholistanensis]MVA75863.1 DinB family protein [Auraticoccus cholistanensis]
MSDETPRSGAAAPTFVDVDLRGATFRQVDLSGARFADVDLTGARVRGALLSDVDLSGDIRDLRIYGIDVVPLVEAELDRRHPERVLMRPSDAEGFRRAWAELRRLWAATVAKARTLDPALLHEQVDEEWSFVETLRHLLFATDAWVLRVLLQDPAPWHPLDLPFDEMPDVPGVPRDREARPELAQVLALREDRARTVQRLLDELTDDRLDELTTPVPAPGFPESRAYPVREALEVLVTEEWWHRFFAERDLDLLGARGGAGV